MGNQPIGLLPNSASLPLITGTSPPGPYAAEYNPYSDVNTNNMGGEEALTQSSLFKLLEQYGGLEAITGNQNKNPNTMFATNTGSDVVNNFNSGFNMGSNMNFDKIGNIGKSIGGLFGG